MDYSSIYFFYHLTVATDCPSVVNHSNGIVDDKLCSGVHPKLKSHWSVRSRRKVVMVFKTKALTVTSVNHAVQGANIQFHQRWTNAFAPYFWFLRLYLSGFSNRGTLGYWSDVTEVSLLECVASRDTNLVESFPRCQWVHFLSTVEADL